MIEGTVGGNFESFVPIADTRLSREYSYSESALTLVIWIMFIVIMPVLFSNLLVCLFYYCNIECRFKWLLVIFIFCQIGLAVGDIQAIYKDASFKKSALQVKKMA